MNQYRRSAMAVAALPLTSLLPAKLRAQDRYPAKPIRMIVAYGAGTGSDLIARALCDDLKRRLGWTIVVENREGAAGNVGHAAAAKSANDGYTLLLGTSLMTMSVHSISPPPFDPVQDLTPVLGAAELPMVVVSSSQAPFQSWAEFVTYAKANPGKATYATSGKGSSAHLFTSMLGREFGFQALDVTYKQVSQAIIDTAAGRVDIFMANLPPARALLAGHQLRIMATGSGKRLSEFPQAPTFAELTGRPDYRISLWYGVFAPAGLPKAIADTLREELNRSLEEATVRNRIEGGGFAINVIQPHDLHDRVRSETATFAKLFKEFGLVPQK